jgi:hypothetical protein
MKILIKVNIKPLVKKMPLLSRRGIFLFSDKIEGFSDQIRVNIYILQLNIVI